MVQRSTCTNGAAIFKILYRIGAVNLDILLRLAINASPQLPRQQIFHEEILSYHHGYGHVLFHTLPVHNTTSTRRKMLGINKKRAKYSHYNANSQRISSLLFDNFVCNLQYDHYFSSTCATSLPRA
jgi:hypothetical protein